MSTGLSLLPPPWLTEANPREPLLASPTEAALIRMLRQEPALETLPLKAALARVEQVLLTEALCRHGGNVRQTARALGLSSRGLYLRLARLGVNPRPFRPARRRHGRGRNPG